MKLSSALLLLSLALSAEGAKTTNSKSVKSVKSVKASKSKGSKGSKTEICSKSSKGMNFNRIATFPICKQLEPNCNTDAETVAEIVSVSEDGMTLVYTDSQQETIGFIDITDPSSPIGAGVVDVGGEPTSVAVLGDLAVAAVNTGVDYVNTSGNLVAINISTKAIVKTWPLGGQPDSVAVSPDGKYIVVAIENERDEDLEDGALPQMPAGYVVVITTAEDVEDWAPSTVSVSNLDGVAYPEDPEPEFVAINENNVAVVTLQENNAIVLIDLATKTVLKSFSAGTVDLEGIDTENDSVINQTSSLDGVAREPDGVTWAGNDFFVTADEGDFNGGSRGFTIFDSNGAVKYSPGSFMDRYSASVGHYPETRSGKKGTEPENVAFGADFEGVDYLFVNAERASIVFVYDVSTFSQPKFKQVLPSSKAPEGSTAIPGRNLFVVAGEGDDRAVAKVRSSISIFEYACARAQYPTIASKYPTITSKAGKKTSSIGEPPIPFAALSGLSNDPNNPKVLYSIEDGFYKKSRFFTIETDSHPAMITKATRLTDSSDIFATFALQGEFSAEHLAAMINADKTVNIDPEGIAAGADGAMYIASKGSGTFGDAENPVKSLNFIFKVDKAGVIHQVITLPEELNLIQLLFGIEGITYHPAGKLVVCLQRAWAGYTGPLIGVYDLTADVWDGFVVYPLDAAESQNGGWVGLSDISYVEGSDATFYVLERDNQSNLDAAVKRIYSINLAEALGGLSYQTIEKTLVKDLVKDEVYASIGTFPFEKIEGLAQNGAGWWIVNDNDGVDSGSGETQLLNLGSL